MKNKVITLSDSEYVIDPAKLYQIGNFMKLRKFYTDYCGGCLSLEEEQEFIEECLRKKH